MSLTVSFPFQAGVLVRLDYDLTVQISEPRLDVSPWNEDPNALVRLPRLDACREGCSFDLPKPVVNRVSVCIDHHDQRLLDSVLSLAVVVQFFCEALSHELLARPSAFRTDEYALYSATSTHARQEPSGERLMLAVLTQDNNVDASTHRSHPLAITSDSFGPPSTASSWLGRTLVTPVDSRLSTIPRSLAR